jgi:hypothetical protein
VLKYAGVLKRRSFKKPKKQLSRIPGWLGLVLKYAGVLKSRSFKKPKKQLSRIPAGMATLIDERVDAVRIRTSNLFLAKKVLFR